MTPAALIVLQACGAARRDVDRDWGKCRQFVPGSHAWWTGLSDRTTDRRIAWAYLST